MLHKLSPPVLTNSIRLNRCVQQLMRMRRKSGIDHLLAVRLGLQALGRSASVPVLVPGFLALVAMGECSPLYLAEAICPGDVSCLARGQAHI